MNSQKTENKNGGGGHINVSAHSTIGVREEPIFEYSEIGWEGQPDELALFIILGGC